MGDNWHKHSYGGYPHSQYKGDVVWKFELPVMRLTKQDNIVGLNNLK